VIRRVELRPLASKRETSRRLFSDGAFQRVYETVGWPCRSSTRPGQPTRKSAPTFATRIVSQPTERGRTNTTVRSSPLWASTTGPAAPISKSTALEPGGTAAAAVRVHFPSADRVATKSVELCTHATEGVPFASSASRPSWTPRATTSAEAPPAVPSNRGDGRR
jgi:hypothetical protein